MKLNDGLFLGMTMNNSVKQSKGEHTPIGVKWVAVIFLFRKKKEAKKMFDELCIKKWILIKREKKRSVFFFSF
jgi:hypothetical protein